MIRVRVTAIRDAAKTKPAGYEADVMSAGEIDGGHVLLRPEVYLRLRAKYSKPDLTRTPSFAEKVRNFARSTVKHIATGMRLASDEEIVRRHDICLGCEFYKNDSCTKCGCPLIRDKKFVSKLSWANEECPVGKWGPVGQ